MPRGWFVFTGDSNSIYSLSAGSYVFVGLHRDSFECIGFGEICAIYAVFSEAGSPLVGITHPTAPLTTGILSYIVLSSGFSVDLPQGGDTYLYVRS